jgi:hypothetical protein
LISGTVDGAGLPIVMLTVAGQSEGEKRGAVI